MASNIVIHNVQNNFIKFLQQNIDCQYDFFVTLLAIHFWIRGENEAYSNSMYSTPSEHIVLLQSQSYDVTSECFAHY